MQQKCGTCNLVANDFTDAFGPLRQQTFGLKLEISIFEGHMLFVSS
jgi:hypothetical protein